MAITTRKITTYVKNIKDLSDTPNKDGMTADDLKAFFDGRGDAEIKTSINGIVDDLVAVADGVSGADQVGATALKVGGAVTVQTQLEELKIDKLETSVLETHKASTDHDAHIATLHYTKANMQTSGGSQVNWDNLTNKPNLADSSWKASVATTANLPILGNTIGDQRTVLNDGDGKQAVYSCVATSGDWDAQWDKIADVDWAGGESTRESNEAARVIVEGDRVTAEGLRVTAEDLRVIAEGGRVSAEDSRGTAEGLRVTAESNRVGAEDLRVTAENLRSGTEIARSYIGVYDGGTAYVVGNQVTYEGSTYRCILASTGNLPTNASYWILIALKGTDGADGGSTAAAVSIADTGNLFTATNVETALAETANIVSTKPTMTTANLTYYVATTGSDSNDGLTVETPFLTIGKAISMIPQIVNHAVIVNVASGTYAEDVYLNGYSGKGDITISGATTLAEAVNYSVNKVNIRGCSIKINIKGFKATTTTSSAFEAYISVVFFYKLYIRFIS